MDLNEYKIRRIIKAEQDHLVLNKKINRDVQRIINSKNHTAILKRFINLRECLIRLIVPLATGNIHIHHRLVAPLRPIRTLIEHLTFGAAFGETSRPIHSPDYIVCGKAEELALGAGWSGEFGGELGVDVLFVGCVIRIGWVHYSRYFSFLRFNIYKSGSTIRIRT